MKILPLASLLLLGLISACELRDPDQGIKTEEIISLQVSSDELVADGQDLILVQAELGSQAIPNLSVTFNTSQGQFETSSGGTATTIDRVASGRTATATLVAGTAAQNRVLVSATVTGTDPERGTLSFQADTVITFLPAFPTLLELNLDDTEIEAVEGNSTSLTVNLLRNSGLVSEGMEVFFEAIPISDPAAIVEINSKAIADLQSVTAEVTVGDTIAGKVLLRAWVLETATDTAAKGEIELSLTP